MEEFITFLVKSIVKDPNSVSITKSGDDTNYRYTISVNPEDMGMVIGKEGRTINSIRSLAKAKAVKEGVWVDVEIADQQRDA